MKSAIQTAVLATVLLLAVISLPVVAAPGSNSLFIAGSAFTPRTSAQTVTYPGAGCSYSDKAMTTSVNLPAGSSVTGVRVYYYNQDPSSTLGTFFTSYNGLGGFTDEIVASSTLSSGFASEYFAAYSPIVIDNFDHSYVLTGTMDTGVRLCGMRILYDLP